MAPMPLTGTIGATLTSNAELQAVSSRKALPDQVTSFSLPTIERPEKVAERKRQIELQKRNASKKQKSGRISSSRPAKVEDETGSEQDEEEVEENLLDLEKSLILLQSLRQSRLAMLSSMLPYLSTRHRTSTKYHPPPKDHPFPGGLDPSIMPPTLLNLGRADVRIGPFVFPQTRFSEARVEGGIQDIEGASLLRGGQSDPSTTPIKTPAKKRQRKPKTPKTNDTSIEDRSLIRDGDDQPSTGLMSTNATPTPIKPSNSGISTPSTSAIPMQSTPVSKPSDQAATESTSETPVRTPPVPAPGTPPINEKVVKAVSAAAQNDPALQTLLYVAANNKASPDQLRELAAFIAKVSAGLEKVEREQLEQRKKEEEEQAKVAAKKAARAAEAKARRAAKKAAALEEASKKAADDSVGAMEDEEKDNSGEAIMEDESMDISTTTYTTTKFVPPPSANKVPSYPPIVIVEFRENPSARFVLPLWRDAIVERRKEGGECSIKVSLLLPAIGSSAALRASDENSNTTAQVGKGKKSKNTTNKQNTPTNQDEEGQSKDTFSPTNPPTEEDLKKAAPQGAETRLMTWTIDGTSESPISDALWNIFGRVAGAKTIVDGVEEEQKPTLEGSEELTTLKLLPDDVIAQVIAKIHALPASNQDDDCLPKLRLRPEEIPRDLPDHLSDKFAPKIQTLSSRPIYRMKRTNQGDEEDAQFDVLRNHNIYANNMMMKRIQIKGSGHLDDDDEGADTSMGLDGGGDEMMGYVGGDSSLLPNQKPKRKRHVAKFNEDGTLKLCQACGTNSTPMWRRGPAGKSTLCNACGAKWKVGRLIVPDHPPTIPLKEEKNTQNVNKKEVEEDQSKKAEEAKAQSSTATSDVQFQDKAQSESTEKGKEKERASPSKDEMIVLI